MQNNELIIKGNVREKWTGFNWLYPLFAGIFSYLFYTGEVGVTVPIFTLIFLVLQFVKTPKRHRTKIWWFGASALLLSSLSILRFGNTSSYLAYFLAFIFNSTTVLKSEGVSVLTSFLHFFKSFGQGFAALWIDLVKKINAKSANRSEQGSKRWIIAVIGVVVLTIFFFIYKSISPEFNEWVNKIDLDFISPQWIGTFIFSFLVLYGVFNHYFFGEVSLWERRIKKQIHSDRSDKFESYFSLRQEKLLSIGVLAMLNLMIGLVLFFDFNRYFTNDMFISGIETYTNAVHSSVNLLIFSIVLAVILIGLSLRGRLNFLENKSVKTLAITWLVLNVGLVIVAGFKNYEYIEEYGLTYKRMGVFMYLSLTVIGLVLTIMKIVFNTTLLSLVRQVSFVFFTVFMIAIHFNWDKMIVNFNLNEGRFDIPEMDFDYMRLNMGEDAQISLHQFLKVRAPGHDVLREMDMDESHRGAWERSHFKEDWRAYTLAKDRYYKYFSFKH